jgi:hypothetical protein
MQGAFFSGLYGFNNGQTFNCESANCAWSDEYTMLGFDSTCNNVTTQVTPTCVESDPSNGQIACTYITPSNLAVTKYTVPTDYNTLVSINSSLHYTRVDYPASVQIPTSSSLITFAMYRVSPTDPEKLWENAAAPWEVIECSLQLVSYKYAAVSVQGNQFQVGDKEKVPLYFVEGSCSKSASTLCTFANEDGSSEFQVNLVDWNILGKFLQGTVFAGAIFEGEGFPLEDTAVGPAAFAAAKNISTVTDRIASAMTYRLATSPNSTQAKGQVLQNESFVTVQWPFLTLHVIILTIAVVFLAITSLRASNVGERLWKDSSVALLCHRMLDWDGHVALECGPTALEDQSKHVRISLFKDVGFQVSDTSSKT